MENSPIHPNAAFVISLLHPFAAGGKTKDDSPHSSGARRTKVQPENRVPVYHGILAHIELARLDRTPNMAGKARAGDQGLT